MSSDPNFPTVPAFLTKLWALVEDPSTNDLICWDALGRSFHVLDQIRFAREILPLYFKHNNIASFIRQLNMYGFRKSLNTEALNLKTEKEDLTFFHHFFVRGQEHFLENIKRKTATHNQSLTSLSKKDVSLIFGEVSSLKVQLDSMTETLENLRVENEVLWKEVVNLRQKHARQQQVVSKLVHFFISFVNKDHNHGSIKRKLPLMIKGPSDDGLLQMDKLVSVTKTTQTDNVVSSAATLARTNPALKVMTTKASSDKQLEPLALGGFDPHHSLELSDFPVFEVGEFKQSSRGSDVLSKLDVESTQSTSKELVSKSEPRLILKDFDKEEFSRNLNSFQNSIDNFYDLYSIDATTLFGDQDGMNTTDPSSVPTKRMKLTDNSAGKELMQYIPPDEILNLNDFITESSNPFQKLGDIESLSPLNLGDMEFIQQWSSTDNDKSI